jgi:predicted transcriptional regulator of viral defense system
MSPRHTPRNAETSLRPWKRVVEVAATQWGVINNRQLRECGASRTTVWRWVAEGRVHPLHRDVYAVGHPAIPLEGRLTAALFFAGNGATLSHHSAAWWWELSEKQPGLIDVSVPGRRRSTGGVVIHCRRSFDRTWERRLPVTSVPQTLLDLAPTTSFDGLRTFLAEAEYRRVDLQRVEAILRRGCPGSARLRGALARRLPQLARCRSELERRFVFMCDARGLPLPEVNVRYRGFTIDAMWRAQRVAVELDGLDGHRTPAQLESDHQRDLMLRAAGFVVLRYTWNQVTCQPELVEADVRAALAR